MLGTDKEVTTNNLPLIVDLDGTLTPSDTLVEAAVKLIKQSPLNLIRLIWWLPKGKAVFKSLVATNSSVTPETLPYREPLLNYLRNEKEEGRRLILATASHKIVAEAISKYLGIFDDVIASDSINLKGINKLEAIQHTVGGDFVYAGDSVADISIWKFAKAAVLVDAGAKTTRVVRNIKPIEAEFPRNPIRLHTWLKVLRVHQWLKNLLIFVPILTAFSFLDIEKLVDSAIAFLAFSLTASATYVINDLWDLDNDRIHPRKRFRPLASAEVSIVSAFFLSAFCLIAGFCMAWLVSDKLVLMLALYLFTTSCYSWKLKQYVLIDVIVLSLLYTLRIIAGSVAIEVSTSTWLLAFSVFLFLSLALVKRCSELISLTNIGGEATNGRDYRVADLTVLWPLGIGAAMSAVVIFGLFISSPDTTANYASPDMLWLVAIGLIYWLSRLWIKTARGEMHDDPIVYTVIDRASRIVILCMAATVIAAHYFKFAAFS